MTRNSLSIVSLIGCVALFALGASGCGSSEESTLTQAQQDQMRHPVADPTYKGVDPSAHEKMAQALSAWQQQHANDKPQFNTGK